MRLSGMVTLVSLTDFLVPHGNTDIPGRNDGRDGMLVHHLADGIA
jgi:hypothetical protein